MTDPRETLARIRAQAAAATPGPWDLIGGGEYVTPVGIMVAPDDGGVNGADAEFIAHARTDVPALSAAIRDVLAVADQLDRLAARHPNSEAGRVETAAAHEIRAAITAHIDTTPKEKP